MGKMFGSTTTSTTTTIWLLNLDYHENKSLSGIHNAFKLNMRYFVQSLKNLVFKLKMISCKTKPKKCHSHNVVSLFTNASFI